MLNFEGERQNGRAGRARREENKQNRSAIIKVSFLWCWAYTKLWLLVNPSMETKTRRNQKRLTITSNFFRSLNAQSLHTFCCWTNTKWKWFNVIRKHFDWIFWNDKYPRLQDKCFMLIHAWQRYFCLSHNLSMSSI